MNILEVALPVPLRKTFDYILPDSMQLKSQVVVGMRVRVPFGRRNLVGFIACIKTKSDFPANKLRKVSEIIDKEPLLLDKDVELINWASRYYQHPIGEVYQAALPKLLLQGEKAVIHETVYYQVSDFGRNAIDTKQVKSAPQKVLLNLLLEHDKGLTIGELALWGMQRRVVNNLLEKNWVQTKVVEPTSWSSENVCVNSDRKALNEEQAEIVNLVAKSKAFDTYLIDGITGSGKTEVYLQAIEHVISQGKQALVLIPEIGLSPQTVTRFQYRFNVPVIVLHSQLPDDERMNAWLKGRFNSSAVIIGTRSALFTPMPNLGIIVVDEEHDASFKQQTGFRYNARDLAVIRGKLENVPVVLGSATPSIESLRNVARGTYQYHQLTKRATGATMPGFECVDLRNKKLTGGLTQYIIDSIANHLERDEQVLVFVNRRGFSPTLFCHQCGWLAECKRCDARMTVHKFSARLQCHHCGSSRPLDNKCDSCSNEELINLGVGTEQLEMTLSEIFSGVPIVRVDRDKVRNPEQLQEQLDVIHSNKKAILLGTQMLAKGHHLPRVTLVVVVNADQGLMSSDFRGTERLAQLLIQVAGRAGREELPGKVMIQTHQPDHPALIELLTKGYDSFARALLAEREQCKLPPFVSFAILRAEAMSAELPKQFLSKVRDLLNQKSIPDVKILGPLPAAMERKAGKFRQQVVVRSENRSSINNLFRNAMLTIESDKLAGKVRWSLDVDPYECV